MAPGNPYVNYAMGMSYLLAKQLTAAGRYLEESVSVDPNQVPSLLALGTVFRSGGLWRRSSGSKQGSAIGCFLVEIPMDTCCFVSSPAKLQPGMQPR